MTLEKAVEVQEMLVFYKMADLVTIEREKYTRDNGETWRTRFAVSTYKTVTKSGGTYRRLATYRDYGDALTALAWAGAFSDKSLPSPEDMIVWDTRGKRPEGIAEVPA